MEKYGLAGRTVAITGSLGGLGRAVAIALRKRGANLALMDLDLNGITEQAMQLGGEGCARGWRVNVRSLESLESAMAGAAEHFGRIDVVLANAGIDTIAPMATIEPEAYERVIDINLNGVWRTFRAALPYVQAERGYMAATSSMAAFFHSPLQASYTASKAGVWAMCDSIRLELRHLGVGVGSIHPTFFPTPMTDDIVADAAGNRLWRGNKGGFWKMVPLELVVDEIVRGIERRADMIVIPKSSTIFAKAAGFFRPVMERFGFQENDIEDAIKLASASGWHDKSAIERNRETQ
jgi:NAD(P)-dependent dehydrogenase (short-subunit alcohol dehydrogenase family)